MNIIGGLARGHKIFAPDNIRPTSGKVREALFSMIDVQDKTFLDLFAGSGAVGIEALSRGAKRAVLVERSRKAVVYIKRNLEKTHFEGEIINKSVSSTLDKIEETFDFIFMDPPYNTELIKKTLKKIDVVLKDNSVIIIERPSDAEFEYNGFKITKNRIYGDTSLVFLKK
jgi:16S rRNA (guanine(966)-N(2))-methyltransferase RsmD